MKKENIFITISIIVLSFMIVFYGTRFVYFYKLSHADLKVGEVSLNTIINKLSYSKDMIREGNNLYYGSKSLSNYLYYSNRYFKIIGIEDDHILLVGDVSTILPFNSQFKDSDIYKWLNPVDTLKTGVYYNSLKEPNKYLDDTKTCIDVACNDYVISKIGMMQSKYYEKAKNYLKDKSFYWLSDGSYVSYTGELLENNGEIYGVRPFLTLKSDVLYYGGSGTYFDPYFINLEDALAFENTEAKTIEIGSYINFDNHTWRVIDNNRNIKMVATDAIDKLKFSDKNNSIDLKDKTSVIYYLNNEYYNKLNKKNLVKSEFNVGEYNSSYLDKYNNQIEAYVGLLEFGDLFMNDFNDSFILSTTGSNNTVYKIVNGKLYEDLYNSENSIYPVISLNKNVKIVNGYGTFESPFEVGEA